MVRAYNYYYGPVTPNIALKKCIAEKLVKPGKPPMHQLGISIHGVPILFKSNDESFMKAFYDFFPMKWFSFVGQPKVVVEVYDPKIWEISPQKWEDESSWDCTFDERTKTVFQRDFISREVKENYYKACFPLGLNDGFFNFLRWLVPRFMYAQGSLLIHSSCVLNSSGEAMFFLGPSGAGKTTISQLAPFHRVLGDDMNVIRFDGDKIYAQAGALGQAITNPDRYGQDYPVRSIYWLKQGVECERVELSLSRAFVNFHSCIANLFWERMSSQGILEVMKLATRVLNKHKMYELTFPKNRRVWHELESKYQSL